MKKFFFLFLILTFGLFAQEKSTSDEISEIKKRLDQVEKKSILDKLNFEGEYRFEANSIQGDISSYIDGLKLQNMVVSTIFYYASTGMLPSSWDDVSGYIATHYGDWLYFASNLTFDQLKSYMSMFPPEMQQALFSMYIPLAYRDGYSYENEIFYTNLLKLSFKSNVAPNISFAGRLSMYKAWGDSTGVQVFNGQSNSISLDGTTTRVPNSDILRVERAYFKWDKFLSNKTYLSIGRRPSTEGPPLELKEGTLRGGTPLGLLVDYQYDGVTFGWDISEHSTFRLCYGVGFESGFGQAQELKNPADRLKDVHMGGINWDIYKDDHWFVLTTVMRAFDVTDGFNGLAVMNFNPVTGETYNAPVVMRYSPSANLGDLDLAGLLVQRKDGPFDYFLSYGYLKSHPNKTTTPFGGLFSDPFEEPKERSGYAIYGGLRYSLKEDKTMVGLEYNRGSKYWFNFALGADDVVAPKLSARGDVFEFYLLHKFYKNVLLKLDWMRYDYKYSGSGWHIGAPKQLDETPILPFPTYDKFDIISLSLVTKF
ncbi:MAG: DUF3373 family protein [Thermoanaerobaculia bacterium]